MKACKRRLVIGALKGYDGQNVTASELFESQRELKDSGLNVRELGVILYGLYLKGVIPKRKKVRKLASNELSYYNYYNPYRYYIDKEKLH